MAHKDSGWRPKGVEERYGGYEVWDHEISPHGKNTGEVDGEIELEYDLDEDGDADVEQTD